MRKLHVGLRHESPSRVPRMIRIRPSTQTKVLYLVSLQAPQASQPAIVNSLSRPRRYWNLYLCSGEHLIFLLMIQGLLSPCAECPTDKGRIQGGNVTKKKLKNSVWTLSWRWSSAAWEPRNLRYTWNNGGVMGCWGSGTRGPRAREDSSLTHRTLAVSCGLIAHFVIRVILEAVKNPIYRMRCSTIRPRILEG